MIKVEDAMSANNLESSPDNLPPVLVEETLEFTHATQKEAPVFKASRRAGHPLNDSQEEKELI